jgi:hypothetical protein
MDWSDDMVVTWIGDMKWHVEMENTLNPRIWPPWKEEVAYTYLIGVRCLLCLQSIYDLNVYKLQACVELTSIPPTLQGSMGNLKPLVHANLFNEQKIVYKRDWWAQQLQGSIRNLKDLVHANVFNEQKTCIQERLISTTKTSVRPLAKANMIWKCCFQEWLGFREVGLRWLCARMFVWLRVAFR